MQQEMIAKNIIITEPSKNLRALGRNALAGKWYTAILAVVICLLCITVPYVILNEIFGINLADMYTNQYGMNDSISADMYNNMPSYSVIGIIYVLLVIGAFTLGQSIVFLSLFRKQQTSPADTFLGFEHFGKALGLIIFQSIFIFLWSLLCIIPGIIASLRYSQAFFILADDSSKGVRQCMNESKMMMKGNKTKYFCLSLSFIGWILLASIPAAILQSIAEINYASSVVLMIVSIIGSLLMVPVTAYIFASCAGFYEILAGHLINKTEPAPVHPEDIAGFIENEKA